MKRSKRRTRSWYFAKGVLLAITCFVTALVVAWAGGKAGLEETPAAVLAGGLGIAASMGMLWWFKGLERRRQQ